MVEFSTIFGFRHSRHVSDILSSTSNKIGKPPKSIRGQWDWKPTKIICGQWESESVSDHLRSGLTDTRSTTPIKWGLSYPTVRSHPDQIYRTLHCFGIVKSIIQQILNPLIKFLDTYTFCIVVYIEGWSTERETVNFYKRQEIEVGSIWTLEKLRSSIWISCTGVLRWLSDRSSFWFVQ